MKTNRILVGDALAELKKLPDESIDSVVTSPPYWGLRDYGHDGQLGQESTFEEFIKNLLAIFDEVKRVLKPTGTCWVNLGDTYNSGAPGARNGERWPKQSRNDHQPKARIPANVPRKSLVQIPARFAIGMCERGWILRNEIIWHKPNAMPQSVGDRFTADFEKLLFFTKSSRYHFEQQFEPLSKSTSEDGRTARKDYVQKRPSRNYVGQASRGGGMLRPHEAGRNKRSVWSIPTKPYGGAHFAVYPVELVAIPISAGTPQGGVVLDPFFGSGTTGIAAERLGRKWLGIEINPEYVEIAKGRLKQAGLGL